MKRYVIVLSVLASLGLIACSTVSTAPPVAEKTFTARHNAAPDDVSLWYKSAGRADASPYPLVYLAGGPGGNSFDFEVLAGRSLEPSLRVIYFDQRGTGRSERPESGEYSMDALVEDLEALRRELGAPKITILTHSFGTLIGLEYAARYPQFVERMILTGPLWSAPRSCRESATQLSQLFPDAYTRAFPQGAAAASDDEICDLVFRATPGDQREELNIANMHPDRSTLARLEAVRQQTDLPNTGELSAYQFRNGLLRYEFDKFDRLTMPVLVVSGELDWAAGPATQRELSNRLPCGRRLEYPGAGHWMFIDRPERFRDDVIGFLSAEVSCPAD